jgi:hypothetical protein
MSKKVEEGKPKGNAFAVLDLSSDSESSDVEVVPEVKQEVAPRQWTLEVPPEPASLFTRGKAKRTQKKKEDDGWTSIVWNRPRFMEDDEERKIREELIEEATLNEPKTPQYTDEDTHKTTQLAKEWAAKLQADLERAEKQTEQKPTKRTDLSEDFVASLGKLSFFRRPMAVEKE